MNSTFYLRSLIGSLFFLAASLLTDTRRVPLPLAPSPTLATPGGTAESGGVGKPLSDGTLTFCVLNGETTANLLWDAAPGEGEEFQLSSTSDFSENVLPFQPAQLGAGTWYARLVNTSTQATSGVLAFSIAFVEGIQITAAQVIPVSCAGGGGAVDLAVSGGSGQYAYAWTNDANATTYTTEDLSNLTTAATYTVVVTDTQSGCTAQTSVAVAGAEPLVLITPPTVSNVVCAENADGQIEVTVQGGSGRYQFSRDGGITYEPATPVPAAPGLSFTYTFTGLGVGSYSVRVKDTGGCETEPVAVEIVATDNVPPTLASLNPISANTDPNLCSASVSVPTPGATDNCTGTVTVSGARSDNLTLGAPYPKGVTTITWRATDASNNPATATQTVTVSDNQPPATPELAAVSGCEVTLQAPTTTDNCAGTVTGTTNSPLTYTTSGTYTVTWTFSDGNGNASQATQSVTVYGEPTLGFTATGTTSGSASSAGGPASLAVSVCAGSNVAFSALSRSNNDHVGALIVVSQTSGNVKRSGSTVETYTTPVVVAPANMGSYFSASYGPYTLSSGFGGTFQQVVTPFYDVPPHNGTYEPGQDCLGVPVTVNYTVNAVPALTIANPAAVCAPATVNLTAAAVTAGSVLPPGTTLGYFTDAAGTAALANPGAVSGSGTYSVKATSPAGCSEGKPVVVTVNPAPTAFGVTGGGGLCDGGTGVPVGLSGSQPGVNYQLKRNGTNVGAAAPGTGNALGFGTFTTAGTYTVEATNATTACSAAMTGSAAVSVGTFSFSPQPTVSGLPGCAGQSITLQFNVTCSEGVTFVAQVSNANGGFGTPLVSVAVNPGTTVLALPASAPQGTGYRLRVVASNPAVTSNPTASFTINALTLLTPTTPAKACQGGALPVTFATTGNCPFLSGNAFTVQVSSATGSFNNPTPLGTASPGTTSFLLPASLPAGTGYRVRVVSTNPGQTSPTSAPFQVESPSLAVAPTVGGVPVYRGAAVTVSFNLPAGSCPFPTGNAFTAQLSSASGSFSNPVSLGTVQAGQSNSLPIPAGTAAATGYRIRIVSSDPGLVSTSSVPFQVKVSTSRLSAEEPQLVVAPNPSAGREIRCQVRGMDNPEFKLLGTSGRAVALTATAGEAAGDWVLRPAQPPSAGVYAVQVSEGQNRLVKRVVLVE